MFAAAAPVAVLGACCFVFLLAAAFIGYVGWLVVKALAGGDEKKKSVEQAAGGFFDFDANRRAFEGRMRAAIDKLPEGDPLRTWAEQFGMVGHLSSDPFAPVFYMIEGPATPPELPLVKRDRDFPDPFTRPLPDVPYPFAVDFTDAKPTPKQLRALTEYPHLAGLLVGTNQLGEKSLQHVGRMTGLRVLTLACVPEEAGGLRHLAGLTDLWALHVSGLNADALTHLHPLVGLTNLNIHCDLTDAAAHGLFRRLTALQYLDFKSDGSLTPGGVRSLEALAGLVRLRMSVSGITAGHVAALERLPNLRSLDFSYCYDFESACLQGFGRMPALEELNFEGNQFGQGGLQHLAGLPNLRKLDLGRTGLTDAGLAALPPLPNLEELDLRTNRIIGPGLACLAGMPKLRTLILDSNPLEDDGLRYLVGLNQLTKLDISGTKVTKECAKYVYQLPGLAELILVHSLLTHDEAGAVAASWPAAGVLRHIHRAEWQDPNAN